MGCIFFLTLPSRRNIPNLGETHGSMGDLIGFEGFLNSSTPFTLYEHKATWRAERQYPDFKWSNEYNDSCTYPRFWDESGLPVVLKMTGCYNRYRISRLD